MIVALLGYVGAMVAAFVALVVAYKAVTGPPQMEKVHQQPLPIGAIAQGTTPDAAPAKPPGAWGPPVVHKPDASSDTASAEAAQLAADKDAAEKAKRLQQARHQKRKTQIARQPQEQRPYSTALGYDQERLYDQQRGRDYSSGPLFNMFGPRRY
jgi:hypothetical protein